jgi:hypothetical protein
MPVTNTLGLSPHHLISLSSGRWQLRPRVQPNARSKPATFLTVAAAR